MALKVNIFVTVLVLSRLNRAGHFNWLLFLHFVIASMPMVWKSHDDDYELHIPAIPVAMLVGAILRFVSGLTGVGSGIFLSPLLLFFHWTNRRGSAAIAAGFILLNSIAGLAGYTTTDQP